MRFGATIILAACAAASVFAYAPPAEILARGGIATAILPRQKSSGGLFKRAVAPSTAPSGNYTPSANQICPTLLVRQPSGLLDTLYDGERTWVASRRANAVSYWSSYLNNTVLNFTSSGFNLTSFLSNTSNLPNVAIAVSGGGYRAMIHGGALLNAFDARNSSSVAQGTGGILQLATYIAGLSGGSWLVGSLAVNDYPTIFNLTNVWNLEESLVNPPNRNNYYQAIRDEAQQKASGGFNVTITDLWGRALSRHLINNTNFGLATTFSSVQILPSFSNHLYPFPIVMADSRRQGETIIPINNTIYEFTPLEFGSWNPDLRAFIPMQYVGTSATNGTVNATEGCVLGFDNAGFVMGTSSSLFNSIIYGTINSDKSLVNILGSFLQSIIGQDNDTALYPNPFQGLNPRIFSDTAQPNIDLVDGGEDGENLPLWPLIHPGRQVDVILSLDASADTSFSWPNGSSLVQTRNRVMEPGFGLLANYPNVPPDTNTFLNRGLNAHTTFFGCNDSISTPLIVYIPNAPYISYTNFSTLQLAYTDLQVDNFLENGFREARGNSTVLTPATLPYCLACALVSRAERRAGIKQTPQCAACFNAYCWDGVSDSSTPTTEYTPSIPGVYATNQTSGAGTKEKPNFPGDAAALSPLTAAAFAGVVSGLTVLAGSLTLL